MELLIFLNKALWITAFIFGLYWLIKYFYRKFKPQKPVFFYLHHVEKADGEWKVRIEAPSDNFDVDIQIFEGQDLLAHKKACLIAGLNKISIKSSTLYHQSKGVIKIQSADQKLERRA